MGVKAQPPKHQQQQLGGTVRSERSREAAAGRPAGSMRRQPGHHGTMLGTAVLVLVTSCLCAGAAAEQHAYTNVFGRVTCFAEAVVKPESTQQLAGAVKQFADAAKASGRPLKIRASRSVFHSTASFTCPFTSDVVPVAPDSSRAAPSTVAVLTEGFDKVLEVDAAARTVRVQAGLKVLSLLQWAEANGFATTLGAPTNYAELTIGGVISANGHGTGSNVTSAMGDIALEFTWVDASGRVHVSARDSPEGRGLAGGLGSLGLIAEVKLQLTPPSSTKVVSINLLPDGSLASDVLKYLQTTPNVALMWRPDLKIYNAFLMHGLAPAADGAKLQQTLLQHKPGYDKTHAGLTFPLPTLISNMFQLVMLPLQADITDSIVSKVLNPLNCLGTGTSLAYLRWASKSLLKQIPGAPLDLALPQIEGTGSTNKMMAGGCEPFCVWNSELTTDDVEMAIELDDFPAWVEDVKKIFAQDLAERGTAHGRCMPFGGYVFLRFGRGVADNMAVTSGMRRPIYVELTYMRSRKLKEVPGKYQFVQDLLEQLTLCKYGGRPHWGKNYDRTFTHPTCTIRDRLPNFDRQLALQAAHDPGRVFEPLLLRAIVDRTPNAYGPRCDVKRQCFCTEDSHCADGFACTASLAFPEYRVCKPVPSLLTKLG